MPIATILAVSLAHTVNVFFDCAQDLQAKELCKKVTGQRDR